MSVEERQDASGCDVRQLFNVTVEVFLDDGGVLLAATGARPHTHTRPLYRH